MKICKNNLQNKEVNIITVCLLEPYLLVVSSSKVNVGMVIFKRIAIIVACDMMTLVCVLIVKITKCFIRKTDKKCINGFADVNHFIENGQ